MIKRCLILFLLGTNILLSACKHQTSNDKKPNLTTDSKEKKSPGKIEFSKEIHNFGTLKEGEIVVYSFQFRNTGGSPFQLSKVEAGCGCLRVQYSKEDILPQAVSVVDVIFDSAGEWGNQIKSVNIETSNGETKTLSVGAFVENKNFNTDLNN